ncbi:hypothetical protein BLNAU_17042 [Blattamonas nauphoetae]|uniref:Uncharacterized protein n=1 Tax=Blattamonas nauphoetae TaxID=2049346 RepID=A0ABQ9X7S0_9EUKA|nr:hypothetical protein BLNAU_17042 [Blattamonas nauphoetae]
MFLPNMSFPILTFLRSDEMAELSSVSDLRGTGILLSDLIEQIVMSEDLTQPRLSLFEDPQTSTTPSRVPLAAACLHTLICLLTVDPTLPLLFTPEDQCNIFNINFILHALKLLLAHSEIMLNSSGTESPLSQSASLTSPTPSSQELFGDSLFLPLLKTQSASESFTLVDDSDLLLLKENDQKAELARVLSPTARTSLTASPPLRLFNPRPSLRMSIVRQPTPATPQQFTAGRSPHPLDENFPKKISGDMRHTFVHPGTRFEGNNSDSEPPPPPSEPPSPGPPTPEPTPPPENEEWESDVLLPSPPQTMSTLTQRQLWMLLVSVQIITHSLSLLILPVCDDLTRLLNSTQHFTFDMSAARKGYNVGHDAVLHTLLHYSLAAFLMLFNEAFHATSFNLTQNPQRMETMLIVDRHDTRLNQNSNDAINEAEAKAVKTKKSLRLLNISAIEGILILGLLFIPLDLPTTLPVTDYAPLPPMSISFGMSKEHVFPESANEATAPPVVDADHLDTADADLRSHGSSDLPSQRPQDSHRPHTFKMQLVKYSGIFHAWWVGQDETAKTQFPIRKGWDGECEGDEADWVHTVLRSRNEDSNELMTQLLGAVNIVLLEK